MKLFSSADENDDVWNILGIQNHAIVISLIKKSIDVRIIVAECRSIEFPIASLLQLCVGEAAALRGAYQLVA